MPQDICSTCQLPQFSVMDKAYLEQNGQCWACDRREWEAGKLPTEEFERRERIANQIDEQ